MMIGKKIVILLVLFLGASPAVALSQGQVVDKIVALVDDQVITQADLSETLRRASEGRIPGDAPRGRQETLQYLINEKILITEIDRQKITVTEQEISDGLQNTLRQRGQTEVELQDELAKQNLSLDKLRQKITLDLKRGRFLQKVIYPRIRMTDYDIQEYYRQHKHLFQGFDKIRYLEILLSPDTVPPGEKFGPWAAKMVAALKQGTSFSEMAKKYSRGAFAAQGGDSGLLDTKSMRQDLLTLLLSGPVGVLSDPIPFGGGFYIFKVLERQTPRLRTVAEVKDEVQQLLAQERVIEELERYLVDARSHHYVEIRP